MMKTDSTHWVDPEGWEVEGGGRGVQDAEHRHTHGEFKSIRSKPIQCCKVKLIN